MARPLRIEVAGGLYHVTSRGDRRKAIFEDEQDRQDWPALMDSVCARFNWRCHAYFETGELRWFEAHNQIVLDRMT